MQSDIIERIIEIAFDLLYLTPILLYLILSIFYLVKAKRSTEGLLMLVGSLLLF